MSSTKINLGKVALTPKGEWNAATTYERLDVVSYQGSSYTVLKECIGQTPSEGEYYSLLASKGAKGDKGDFADPVVTSFNGRTGPVVPAAGDYTPEMVGTLSAEKINDLCQTKSNKNMCRNWDLRKPVNSQGRSTYDPSHGWRRTIDIWEATGTRVDVMNGYVKITSVPDIDKWSRFTQMTNFDLVPGNTYTLTIHARVISVDGTVFLRFCDKEFGYIANSTGKSIGSFSLYETNDFDTMSVTITPDGSKVYDHFGFEIIANGPQETGSNSSFEIDIKAIKLELGSTQTLVNNNGEIWRFIDPPEPDLQRLLCSQYGDVHNVLTGFRLSNENILDNWYFIDPINQNMLSVYSNHGYTFDRWFIPKTHNATVTLTSKGIKFKPITGGTVHLQQAIPSLTDGVYTISMLTDEGVLNSVVMKKTGNTFTFVTKLHGNPCVGLQIHDSTTGVSAFFMYTDVEVCVVAAKVERGYHQTLAILENKKWVLNDPAPNRTIELLKCQRYYYRSWTKSGEPDWAGINAKEAITAHRLAPADFPVIMRCTPVITIWSAKSSDSTHVPTSGCVTQWTSNEVIQNITAVYADNQRFVPGKTTNLETNNFTAGKFYAFHYIADANL